MLRSKNRVLLLAGGGVALALGIGAVLFVRLDRAVTRAASPDTLRASRFRPLAFRPAAPARRTAPADDGAFGAAAAPRAAELYGDGTVSAATVADGVLWTGGGSGLERLATSAGSAASAASTTSGASADPSRSTARLDVRQGLPSLRVSALASWRGVPVFALERRGWGRVAGTTVELATSGWGDLQVRALAESPGGELLIGARQGLFRAAAGAAELEKLDGSPVRALALLPDGSAVCGGESGLRIVSPAGIARVVGTPDPWIESVGVAAGRIWAATPVGVASASSASIPLALEAHPRGADATSGTATADGWAFVPPDDPPRVATLLPDGGRREEGTRVRIGRLLAAEGTLLGDGPDGLLRRDRERGWVLVAPRPKGSLPLPHVAALASAGDSVWAGFFDGGVARTDGRGTPAWTVVSGREAWGVNALLPAGGALFAATLRGAFRIEGARATAIAGAGAAFSLAATTSGLAVGYAQGVALPDHRLLSAFHGLPGNQAYALASAARGEGLWVGTPTGLGRVQGRRVTSRVVPGEGKLPNPWVTALLDEGESLLVATYGGGVARRRGEGRDERWEPFPETAGLKVNAGALALDREGRVLIGTMGHGVLRTDRARTRFEPLPLPLPSPDVFSLAFFPADSPEALLVGTDEGLLRLPLPAEPETR